MKEISIFIRTEDLAQVTEILKKHNVGGISFYDINGAGRAKRNAIPEMVRSYMTGRTVTPDYVKRTKVETIVADSSMNQIVEGILNNIIPGKEAQNVDDAYEIGTRQRGEAVLSSI